MFKEMFKVIVCSLVVLSLMSPAWAAEKYPDRPIEFICTWGVGSGATAVMMGAFLLHGIQPGPLLFAKSPESVYTVFSGMLVCNLIMILAGLVTAKFFSELMRVPENILSAFIISFCLLGAFALRNDMTDVWFMVISLALLIMPFIRGLIKKGKKRLEEEA